MNKIEEIEKVLADWKAKSKAAYEGGDYEYEKLCMDRSIGIAVALAILKRPSDTKMQSDSEPCSECEKERKNYPWPPFCKWCGKALSR